MQLEVGKKYRRRDGGIVTIKRKTGFGDFPFESDEHLSYRHNGQWWQYEDRRDLIEEIKEQTAVSNKADNLNKLINEMPVCNDGKSKIRALVEEITGEKLTKQTRKLCVGQVYIWEKKARILVYGPNGHEQVMSADGRFMDTEGTWQKQIDKWDYAFAAESLAEYVANGGKL